MTTFWTIFDLGERFIQGLICMNSVKEAYCEHRKIINSFQTISVVYPKNAALLWTHQKDEAKSRDMDEWLINSLRDHDDENYGGDNMISNSKLITYFSFRRKVQLRESI